jgi:hypothetical protein
MSLQLAAQHLSNQGRGPDNTLVHMSRNEVKSLNDLAMAHGGQLTINPQTGLPEAGFLSSLLPMLAGAALTAAGVPAPMAGMLVGGGSMLMNPKAGLMGGLMAGLGAYGGAGLGEALAQQGMSQATAAKLAEDEAFKTLQTKATDLGAESAMETARATGPAKFATAQSYVPQMQAASGDIANYANNVKSGLTPTDFMGRADMMGQGAKTAMQPGGLSSIYEKLGDSTMSRVGTVAGLAAPILNQQSAPLPVQTVDKDMGQRYRYSPGVTTPQPAPDLNPYGGSGREQRYYTPSYEPISNDEAKSIYHFADGGATPQAQATPQNPAVPQFAMPKDNPNAGALNLFKDMQAQSATQAAAQPAPVDVAKDYANYVKNVTAPLPKTQAEIDAGNAQAWFASNPNITLEEATATGLKNGLTANQTKNYFDLYGAKPSTIPTGDPNATPSYTYNPATKTYTSVVAPKSTTAASNTSFSGMGGGDDNNLNMNYGANGGLMAAYADGGSTVGNNPVERMSNANAVGANTGFPQAYMPSNQFAIPTQTPVAQNVLLGAGDVKVDPYTGEKQMATGGISDAGYNLGGYSDGGRLLRGPGDGVSDSIPATIGHKQPARLADGEFVVPARIVSELGNGSTEAGARKLYAMMDRIQASRKNTVGKGKVAKNNRADKYLPA